jgi:hypothetical protein
VGADEGAFRLAAGRGARPDRRGVREVRPLEADLDGKAKHIERLERELELDGKLTRSVATPASPGRGRMTGYKAVPTSRVAP